MPIGLPDALIIELQKSVRALDMEQTNAALDRLDGIGPEPANALRHLVEQMDFVILMSLLNSKQQQKGNSNG